MIESLFSNYASFWLGTFLKSDYSFCEFSEVFQTALLEAISLYSILFWNNSILQVTYNPLFTFFMLNNVFGFSLPQIFFHVLMFPISEKTKKVFTQHL